MKKITTHLLGYKEDGSDVIGVYPLLPDGRCRFIVFDFDNHEKGAEATDFANVNTEWHKEVDALRKMCEINGIKPLVERSRSGKGAHVWIFFKKAVSASLARSFGFLLLDKGSTFINLKSFHYYDRMYPSQEMSDSLGNQIALPLQGQALRNGNSAFVDENWNAYPDQWDVLFHGIEKLSAEDIENYMRKWQRELSESRGMSGGSEMGCRPKPWKKKCAFRKGDVTGRLHMVLGNGVYIDTLNLMPGIQNQIRSLAAFDNPEFYKNKRLGYSNYYNFSTVYLGKDIDGYIQLPRGLRERVLEECKKAGIEADISDQREKGCPIRVSFNGDLRIQQELAAEKLLMHSDGVLSAATAFGKTVVCSYLIAERKVNTLILLQSKDLLNQWVEELGRFLEIKEEPPEYETKTGRTVFAFHLPISGEHQIEARYGEVSDVMEIRKVEEENPAYRMKKEKPVSNWFDADSYDESCYSVFDKFSELQKNPEAAAVMMRLMEQGAKSRGDVAEVVTGNPALIRMMGRMTVESLLNQAGADEENIKQVNRILQGIKKA